jgi:hypothetical protein
MEISLPRRKFFLANRQDVPVSIAEAFETPDRGKIMKAKAIAYLRTSSAYAPAEHKSF